MNPNPYYNRASLTLSVLVNVSHQKYFVKFPSDTYCFQIHKYENRLLFLLVTVTSDG